MSRYASTSDVPPAADLADRVVASLFAIARDISKAPQMRQLPLFKEDDESWLSSVRVGMTAIVLRVTIILFAEAKGILPLGSSTYDDSLALTHRANANTGAGIWQRLLRLQKILSGEAAVQARMGLASWDSPLFGSSLLHPFQIGCCDGSEPLQVSDKAMLDVLQRLVSSPLKLLEAEHVTAVYERSIGFELVRCSGRSIRWRNGIRAHFTPPNVVQEVMRSTLALLIGPRGMQRLEKLAKQLVRRGEHRATVYLGERWK